MENDTLVAVDLAKTVFEVVIADEARHTTARRRLTRTAFAQFLAVSPKAVVVMEACGSAHYWGRIAETHGHRVVLLPPHQVRPYVVGNKTDRNDASGILAAYRTAGLRPVPVKNVTQQAIGSLHRLRSAWMDTRTARLNTVRGLLRELGIVIPVGAREVVPQLWAAIGDADSALPTALRASLAAAAEEIADLERRIDAVDKQLAALATQMPPVGRLLSVPGIGLLTATALYAFVGDVARFDSGRHFASFLGLTPREYSSGCRRRLGRISKRGDRYLRTLLIHGARSVLVRAKTVKEPDRLRTWALALQARVGHNKATVALANKLARLAWAVWRGDGGYLSAPAA